MEDKFVLGGKEFKSRFILGSGKYNLNLIKAAVEQGGAEIITLALRRANTQEKDNILDFIPKGVTLLPNTSGARNAEEAVRIARLSRAMGDSQSNRNSGKGRLRCAAIYESGFKCGKGSPECRSSSGYAIGCTDRK